MNYLLTKAMVANQYTCKHFTDFNHIKLHITFSVYKVQHKHAYRSHYFAMRLITLIKCYWYINQPAEKIGVEGEPRWRSRAHAWPLEINLLIEHMLWLSSMDSFSYNWKILAMWLYKSICQPQGKLLHLLCIHVRLQFLLEPKICSRISVFMSPEPNICWWYIFYLKKEKKIDPKFRIKYGINTSKWSGFFPFILSN